MFQELKYKFQRAFRGYSDDIKWSFSGYFRQFIKPLKEFCEDELKEIYVCPDNENRIEIYKETLRLIKQFEEKEDTFYSETEATLWAYVGKNLLVYWN